MMEEFTDTYTDDLCFIDEALTLFRTHPLRNYDTDHLDAHLCRILLVFAIGSIESMMENWKKYDQIGALNRYFGQKRISKKIDDLYTAFHDAGIKVSREVFDDFLAMKYMRNSIVHAEWNTKQKILVEQRGFPTDSRKFTKDHYDRIFTACQKLFLLIFLTRYPSLFDPQSFDKIKNRNRGLNEETGILRTHDLDTIIWNNLDRIKSKLHKDIERTVTTQEYDWTGGHSITELDNSQHQQLYFQSAWRAGNDGYKVLAQNRSLAADALEFWREYQQRAITPTLDMQRVNDATQVLKGGAFDPQEYSWSLIQNLIDNLETDTTLETIEKVLRKDGRLCPKQVFDALTVGKHAHALLRNRTPVTLLEIYLPIVDPQNISVYVSEANTARQIFTLGRIWYEGIENKSLFDESHPFTAMSVDFITRSKK